MTEGIIRLVSTDRAVNRLANIGPDGTFEIKAYNGAGLPQGTYRVAVMPGRIPTSNDEDFLSQDSPEAMKSNIPAKYREIDTSDVTIEVKAGENPPHAIELK